MEISIKWSICRLCLHDEQKDKQRSAWKTIGCFQSESMTVDQIYDVAGVRISLGDSLPDKICGKCQMILKYLANFRKLCLNSERYLQCIMQRTRSATTLFQKECRNGGETTYDVLQESYETAVENDDHILKTIEEHLKAAESESRKEPSIIRRSRRVNSSKKAETKVLHTKCIKRPMRSRKKFTRRVVDKPTCKPVKQPSSDLPECDETDNNASGNYSLTEELANDSIVIEHNQFEGTIIDSDPLYATADSEDIFEEETLTSVHSDVETLDAEPLSPEIKELTALLTDENKVKIEYDASENENSKIIHEGNGFGHFFTLSNIKNNVDEMDNILQEHHELLFEEINEVEEVNEQNTVVNGDATTSSSSFLYKNVMNEAYLISHDDITDQAVDNTSLDEENSVFNGDEEGSNQGTEWKNIKMAENHETVESIEEAEDTEYSIVDYVDERVENTTVHITQNNDSGVTMEIDMEKCDILSNNIDHKGHTTRSRLFICHICGNHFVSRQLLTAHLKVHRQEKSHECEICMKRFITSCNLQAHMRTHTGEKPFECQYCQRRFTDRSTHLRHERVHTNERPFICRECNKTFSLATTLQAHMRVHSGERPFKCGPCMKSFKLPHQLKAHKNSYLHKSVVRLTS